MTANLSSITRLASLLCAIMVAQACSLTPYQPGSLQTVDITQRAVAQEIGAFNVRASVPSEEESEELFDIPIYKRGIQPVWLEITNISDTRARFVLSSVDREYFSPLEVAYMHKKYFSKQGWMDMEKFLYQNAMPRMIGAGETESGFVFTHATNGTKSFNVDIFHADNEARYEQFTFFIQVPGFVPDHADVNFESLYADDMIQEVDAEGFREALLAAPCCTTNRDGNGRGQPVNVALIGKGITLLRALLRAGWSETSYIKDAIYLNNSHYLYGRPPDAIFKKGRGRTTERNELSLWLTPVRVDGESVWLGQIKHAIGRRYEIEELFFGTALDPDVDDGRNFFMQNLWYSYSLKAVAYMDSSERIPMEDPAVDFNNNQFFSSGVRAVMWIADDPVSMQNVQNLNWDSSLATEAD